MDNIPKIIGANIRKYRESRGLTREQFAEDIDLDTGYVGQCERGERSLALDKIINIINYFGVSVSDIISIDTKVNTKDKEIYLSEINKELDNCTDNQLLTVLNVIKNIVPYLKD